MWELYHKQSWAPKNCAVVLEKTLESSLDSKEIQPVHPKGNQSQILIERADAEAEVPILWPSDVKNWLIGKDPDAGKDWRKEEKGMTEDEVVGWHHQLDGHESELILGVGDRQGGLACCSPRGHKESDTTEWLNWTNWKQGLKNKKAGSHWPSSLRPDCYRSRGLSSCTACWRSQGSESCYHIWSGCCPFVFSLSGVQLY